MPNYVATTFRISGKDRNTVLERIKKAGDNILDEFIPMPQTYKDYDTWNWTTNPERAKASWLTKELYVGMKRDQSDPAIITEDYYRKFKDAEEYQKNEYGIIGWKPWAEKNWGTKWDTYDVCVLDNEVHFKTAWSFPVPFFEKLAEEYDIYIHGKFRDEFYGFAGKFKIKDKELSVLYDSDEEARNNS